MFNERKTGSVQCPYSEARMQDEIAEVANMSSSAQSERLARLAMLLPVMSTQCRLAVGVLMNRPWAVPKVGKGKMDSGECIEHLLAAAAEEVDDQTAHHIAMSRDEICEQFPTYASPAAHPVQPRKKSGGIGEFKSSFPVPLFGTASFTE